MVDDEENSFSGCNGKFLRVKNKNMAKSKKKIIFRGA
jgi:hypothetical protein